MSNIWVLEVARHAVLDAVATSWVNFIALEENMSVPVAYKAGLEGPEGGRKVGEDAEIERGKELDLYLSRLAPAAPGSTLFVGPSRRHWDIGGIRRLFSFKKVGGQNLGQRLSPSLQPRQQAHREPRWLVTRPRRETG